MKALLLAPMGSVHRRFNECNIAALQGLGYEVHLLANFAAGEGPETMNPTYAVKCRERGIVIHSLPFRRHEIRRNLSLVRLLCELMRTEGFDVVHAHTETGGLLLRMTGQSEAQYIYTAHGMSFYRGSSIKSQMVYRPIEHWICAGMDANIAINAEEHAVLQQWNPKTAHLVHGIGVDLDKMRRLTKSREQVRNELGLPQCARVILSVGELDDNKNHAIVIEALKDTNVYYLICGVGPNEQRLRKLANQAGIGERLVLAGFRNDIPDVVGACDVFAFPSHHEGLPVALLEAMAGGLPVVCSYIRGNVDLVEDGLNGVLVDPNDVDGWRAGLLALLEDKSLGLVYAEASKKVVQAYARDSVQRELVALYAMLGQAQENRKVSA